MPTKVRSFSKINLGLAVGPPRGDGFHALTTVYQTLKLHDVVTVTARPAAETSIVLASNHKGVPRTEAGSAERNTAYRVILKTLERMALTAAVEIHIDKRLPVQGGMGAGSANAIAAMLGFERELHVALPAPERLEVAAEVGSDVPLFLLGGTVLGLGRGEEVYPLPDSPPLHCVIALPDIGVSTALAFQQLDAASLTFDPSVDKLKQLSRALASVWSTSGAELGPTGIAPMHSSEDEASEMRDIRRDLAENPLLALVRTGIENDFEEVVFSQHPSLRSTKRDLVGSSKESACYAALSGSGSALFGLYESQSHARAAQHRVQQHGTRAILTETLPRRNYWDTMFAE
jgi:4-diphosphocytidyl-2-C-methyl-D-erythritol kinase